MPLPPEPRIVRWYFDHRLPTLLTVQQSRQSVERDAQITVANDRLWSWLCANSGRTPEPEELSNILKPDPSTSEDVRPVVEPAADASRGFDKRAYQREYMRQRRELSRGGDH